MKRLTRHEIAAWVIWAILALALSASVASAQIRPGAPPAATNAPPPVADPSATPTPRPRATGEQPVRVEWPEGDLTIGDRVPVTITVVLPADLLPAEAEPRFPTWQDDWGEAEILEAGEVEQIDPPQSGDAAAGADSAARGPRRAWRQTLTLAAFRTGSVPLPPREILVPGADGRSRRLTTPPGLALEIASVLPQPEAGEAQAEGAAAIPEPLAAKPMVMLPAGSRFWWTVGALGLAVLAVLALYHRQRLAAAVAGLGGRAPLPPAEELRRSLAAAREDDSAGEGLTLVSTALRRYLGRRLDFPALESTTTEVRRHLARKRLPGGGLSLEIAASCGEILAACDLVKFARRPAVRNDVRRWADAAEAVADRLETALRPLDEAEEGDATSEGPTSAREAA